MTDAFRYCHYCKADCYEDESEHAADCPTVTRLFPVTGRELSVGGMWVGMRCSDCHEEFQLGDKFTHRKIEDGDGTCMADAPVFEIVCLGCAVLDPEIETA